MRKFVLFLTLGLGVLFFSFNTQALLLEFKDDKALDTWKPVGGDWKIKDKLLEGKTTGYQDLMLNNADSNKWTVGRLGRGTRPNYSNIILSLSTKPTHTIRKNNLSYEIKHNNLIRILSNSGSLVIYGDNIVGAKHLLL
jgi:hypothetical protein